MKPARAISGLVLICTATTLAQPILYVDANATGPTHDGSTWCSAFIYLQDGLDAARASNGAVTEIRVADGVYRPDQGANRIPGDRTAAFAVFDGLAFVGGYAGCGDGDPDRRDVTTLETRLTGDYFGDDDTEDGVRYDNAFRVVQATGRTTIDGCTIKGGDHPDRAGGLLAYSDATAVSGTTLRRVTFVDNRANVYGGAVYAEGDVRVEHCTFKYNVARYGGAVFYWGERELIISDSAFLGNTAFQGSGGAVYAQSDVTIVRSEFRNNVAGSGTVFVWNNPASKTLLHQCLFVSNRAGSGGAFYQLTDGTPRISDCTFFDNSAVQFGGAIRLLSRARANLANCVLWGNRDRNGDSEYSQIESRETPYPPATAIINHSLIQGWTGGLGGVGNIGGDPMFVDPLGPDGVAGTEDDDLRLQRGSPCIDAGDNAAVPPDAFDLDGDGDTAEPTPFDFAGRPRFVNDPLALDTGLGERPIVDMGAFERQAVLLDIDPGRCPNRLSRRSHGFVQAAVVGTDAFDVSAIDLDSLSLARADGQGGSIRPDVPHGRHNRPFRDVTSPFDGDLCDCTKTRRDGIPDLLLRFRANDIADLLDDDSKHGRDSTTFTLTGSLRDGTRFDASDCVYISRGDHRKP